MSNLPAGFTPSDQLPPPEIRASTNLEILLYDGRRIEGWYDSTGYWYEIGVRPSIKDLNSKVVGWRVKTVHK